MDDAVKSFKDKLEGSYKWPALYTFKFICPKEKKDQVKALFTKHDIVEKPSSKGKYVSLTIHIMAKSSDEIIQYYQDVHKIGDIISL